MSPKYIKIDAKNELHIKTILTLSKRNKFYYEDLYLILMRTIEPKSKAKHALLYNTINKNMDDEIEKFLNACKSTKEGLFIVLEKKIIGFLTYDIDEMKISCGLSFLLIDKDYRGSGYGTLLLKYFIELLHEIKLNCVVKIEDMDNIDWYKRFGFKNKEELKREIEYEEGMIERFKYLYYLID
jgi:ribosomal protein S18 acetylase RimI-like enzyme